MRSHFEPTRPFLRIAALLASTAMASLVVGSQLGLAEFYASAPDATLTAKRPVPVAAKAGCALPGHPGA